MKTGFILGLDREPFGSVAARQIGFLCGVAALVCLIAQAIVAAPVAAQTSAGDKAVAEALFDRGVALMKQGKFADACSQLEQSQAIERGVGTLLYLGECYEKLGRTASAWATFREAASSARAEGQLDRAKTGAARADRLEPTLSKLSIQVNAAHAVPGLAVLRNAQAVPAGTWGQPVPVDPGDQQVEARAPGYASWSVTLNLPANGALLTVDVPELTAVAATLASPPAASASTAEPVLAAPTAALTPTASDTNDRMRTWQKPLGLVLGGAGVLGLGIGSYFGLHAIAKKNASDKLCPKNMCMGNGLSLTHDAENSARLSTGFWIGGAALLAAGAIVYFTAPSQDAPQLALRGTRDGAMIEFGGGL